MAWSWVGLKRDWWSPLLTPCTSCIPRHFPPSIYRCPPPTARSLVHVPIRMTVVAMDSGGLFVYAPVAPTAECQALLQVRNKAHGVCTCHRTSSLPQISLPYVCFNLCTHSRSFDPSLKMPMIDHKPWQSPLTTTTQL